MINEWAKQNLPNLADQIIRINAPNVTEETISDFGMKQKISTFINLIRCALYPNIYADHIFKSAELKNEIMNFLREATVLLNCMIAEVLVNDCYLQDRMRNDCDKCKNNARTITMEYMSRLPQITAMLNTDITAAYRGDPAAISNEEVLLAYPGFEAISIYRLAHELFKADVPLLPRIMTEQAHSKTGIDIHPGATIDEYFFIDHGTGVVIGETCTIGKHVKIYQGVTLGAKSFPLDEKGDPIKGLKRHPDIKDNVVIYAGATILGGDTVIGDNCVIGGNSWLTHSVPPNTIVYNDAPAPILANE